MTNPETKQQRLSYALDAITTVLEEPWLDLEVRTWLEDAKRCLEAALAILAGKAAA